LAGKEPGPVDNYVYVTKLTQYEYVKRPAAGDCLPQLSAVPGTYTS